MSTYTLVVDEAQKALITKALESFSYLLQGQTGAELDLAKNLVKALAKSRGTTVILNTVE